MLNIRYGKKVSAVLIAFAVILACLIVTEPVEAKKKKAGFGQDQVEKKKKVKKEKVTVTKAFERAEAAWEKLKAENPPRSRELLYRAAIVQAEDYRKAKKWEKAIESALSAERIALQAIDDRDSMGLILRAKLDRMRRDLETIPGKRADLVGGYWDAEDAYVAKNYEKVRRIYNVLQGPLRAQKNLKPNLHLWLHAETSYFLKYRAVWLHRKYTRSGNLKEPFLAFTESTPVVFVDSRYLSREVRIYKVKTPNGKHIGWVKAEFIE